MVGRESPAGRKALEDSGLAAANDRIGLASIVGRAREAMVDVSRCYVV